MVEIGEVAGGPDAGNGTATQRRLAERCVDRGPVPGHRTPECAEFVRDGSYVRHMTYRPAQFPSGPSSRPQRDARGRWVLPPPAQLGGGARQSPKVVPWLLDPIGVLASAASVISLDQTAPVIETLSRAPTVKVTTLLHLAAALHPDEQRRERFAALADLRPHGVPRWVERFGEAAVSDVVEMPVPRVRHLAIGLVVPGGLQLTINAVIDPEQHGLVEADLAAGVPFVAMACRVCQEHGATLRSIPLNTAARFLERSIISPAPDRSSHARHSTERWRTLIWFVMQRLRLQR
jgi:hypothetical protein